MSERLAKRVNVVGKGSLSVIIPKRWADALGLKPGDRVDLHFDGSKITVTPSQATESSEDVNVLIELENREIALRKLIASYIEGVTRVRIRGSYDQVVKLSEDFRNYVTGFVMMSRPDSDLHDLVFSDIKIDIATILRTLEAISSRFIEEIESGDPSASMTYREFHNKYLYFLRSVKLSIAEDSLDPYEALDLILSVEYIKELLDKVVSTDMAKIREDEDLAKLFDLARGVISALLVKDVETAVSEVLKIFGLLEGVVCRTDTCANVKYLTTKISEIVLGRCIRNKACRCRYFFPKI